MKEPLTKYKLLGATIIIVGVILCVVSTPSGVPTEFTAEQITSYLNSATGIAYYVIIILIILSTAYSIHWFEKTYYADEKLAEEEELVLDMFDDMIAISDVAKEVAGGQAKEPTSPEEKKRL